MHLDYEIPIIIGHVFEADISQNARVVQKYVYPAKFSDCRVDYLVPMLNAVIVGYGRAPGSTDFINNHVCCLHDSDEHNVQCIRRLGL